jgi:two-component system, cell cycle sensor histidine kinase and response regulator CckA
MQSSRGDAEGSMAAPAADSQAQVVLVVDDEDAVCGYMTRVLATAGYWVLRAHDGEEAVTLLETMMTPPGLIVSDLAMPRMTGERLARVIAERWPAVPMLLVSGHRDPTGGYRGPFLQKPFTPGELIAAVSALLPSKPAVLFWPLLEPATRGRLLF